jgi:hypothetical protein
VSAAAEAEAQLKALTRLAGELRAQAAGDEDGGDAG